MPASFRSFNSSLLWRAISIVCVMTVFSYIFFEGDLDGSNFPLRQYPVGATAIVSEVETNIVRPYFARLAEPWTEVESSSLTKQADWVHPYLTGSLVVAAFNLLQRRGYRTALPRSSISDDLPLYA